MSLSATLFGRDSAIFKATNILGLGIPGWLDKKFGAKDTEGPRLSDLSVQTSTYGAPIPRLYGTIAVMGNLIWLENNKLKETVRKKKSGGKGGGGASEPTKTYSYSATFHIALCEGPIVGIRRIWCGDKLLYNAGSGDLETVVASNNAAKGWRLYRGTDDQMPDPRYEADHGAGNVSAHRGLAYIAFYDFQLADYSNTLQGAQFKVEVVTEIDSTVPELIQAQSVVGSFAGPTSFGFQSASVQVGAVSGGLGGTYTGEVIFNNYNFAGDLSGVNSIKQIIGVQGSPNIAFYSGVLIRGSAPSMAVFRESGTKAASFSALDGVTIAINIGGGNPSPYWTESSEYFWCHTPGDSARVSKSDYSVSYLTLPNGSSYEQYFIYEDQITGKHYARWKNPSNSDAYFARIDPESLTVIWQVTLGSGNSAAIPSSSGFYVHDSIVCFNTLGELRAYDVSGESLNLIGAIPKAGPHSVFYAGPGVCFCDSALYRVTNSTEGSLIPLGEIIEKEFVSTGLVSSLDIDATMMTAAARGYRVNGGSVRSALEPLQLAYPYDLIASGYKIKAIPRGQASVATIPWEDIGAATGDSSESIFQQSREMDTQLPAKTVVKYLDAAREYAIGEQFSERLNTEAVNKVELELALVLTADEGAGIAEMRNFLPWLERTPASFTLPPPYRYLEPGDVVTITAPEATYEIRLTEVNEAQDGRLECRSVPNRAALYTPNATGGEGVPPDGTIGISGESVFVPLDIPVIDETLQNAPGFVGVMAGYSDSWPGALAVRSIDDGQTWADLQAYSGKATIGTTQDVLPASDCTLIDQRSLLVYVISGEFESVTRDQMLAGINYAAYGVDGRWEIVRFQNATLQADASYLISGFVRGEKGTEWASGLHEAGDYFILLDDPDNEFIGMAVGSIAVPATYRGVTSGASLDDAADVPFTYQGVNLECLSPVYAKGSRDGSSNFTGAFTRRSRLSSSWWATGVVAPVGEASESYEIDVMDGSTVARTITASTPAFAYSAADQTTDFVSPQASITFRIFQLSATVGRGYPLEVTL